jgi:hypothetical protein
MRLDTTGLQLTKEAATDSMRRNESNSNSSRGGLSKNKETPRAGENQSKSPPGKFGLEKNIGTSAIVFIVLGAVFLALCCCLRWKQWRSARLNTKLDESESLHEAVACARARRLPPEDLLPLHRWMPTNASTHQLPSIPPKVCFTNSTVSRERVLDAPLG